MRIPPLWTVRLLVVGIAASSSGTATAQTPAMSIPVSPHPGSGRVFQFQQVNGLPNWNLGGGGTSTGTPTTSGMFLPPVVSPSRAATGTGGGNIFARPNPNPNNRMIFNPPVMNAFLLAPKPGPNAANPFAINAAFNPWTLNPALGIPVPGQPLTLPPAAIVLASGIDPRVDPWGAAGYRGLVSWSSPGGESSPLERSPGPASTSTLTTDSGDPELVYDPSTRTFISRQPGSLVRPGTPGFLPWIWE